MWPFLARLLKRLKTNAETQVEGLGETFQHGDGGHRATGLEPRHSRLLEPGPLGLGQTELFAATPYGCAWFEAPKVGGPGLLHAGLRRGRVRRGWAVVDDVLAAADGRPAPA
jgi:hypothetical protein